MVSTFILLSLVNDICPIVLPQPGSGARDRGALVKRKRARLEDGGLVLGSLPPPPKKMFLCNAMLNQNVPCNAKFLDVCVQGCVCSGAKINVSMKPTACSFTQTNDAMLTMTNHAMLTNMRPSLSHRGRGAVHFLAQGHKHAMLTPTISRPRTTRSVRGGIVLGQTKLTAMPGSRFIRLGRGGHFVGQGNRLNTHAYTHDPRLKQIAGRIVRKYELNRANVTSTGRTAVLTHNVVSTVQNTADAIVDTVNTLAIGTVASRPLPRGPVGPGAEVTSASPRIVNTLQRHLPAWRALEPGEWIMKSIGPIFLLFSHRF